MPGALKVFVPGTGWVVVPSTGLTRDDADARYATPAYVAQRLPKAFSAAGVQATTSGATELTVATLNVPAQPLAGKLMVSAMLRVGGRTVTTDAFAVNLWVNGNMYGQDWPCYPSGTTNTQYHAVVTGFVDLAANTAAVVVLSVARTSGTGTIGTYLGAPYNRVDALWVAA